MIGLWPNSGVAVFPTRTAPAARNRATAMASVAGTLCSNTAEPNVVRTPSVLTRSFTLSGTPASGPTASPRPTRASMVSASARARSAQIVTNAFSIGSVASIRASTASVASRAETSRRAMAAASSVAGMKQSSFMAAV